MKKRMTILSLVLLAAVLTAYIGQEGNFVQGEEIAVTSPAIVTGPGASSSVIYPTDTPQETAVPTAQPQIVPAKVAKLSAKKSGSLKKVTLSWTSSENATGYVIYRKKGNGAMAEVGRTQQRSYVDAKVKAGSTYTYMVRGCCGSGSTYAEGPGSNACSVKLKPGKVKGLKATAHRGAISLKWKKRKGVSGYQVYMKVFVHIKGIKTKYNRMTNTKSTRYRKGMLVKNMKYGFKVRTYKKVGKKKIFSDFRTVTKRAG